MQRAAGTVGVADHRVLRAPVVPDEEVALLPAVAPGVLGLVELCVQQIEQRLAVVDRPAVEVLRVVVVDEQGASPGLGVGARHRVRVDDLVVGHAAVDRELGGVVHRAQRVDGVAQAVGQALVREVAVREHRVAADGRDDAPEQQAHRRRLLGVGEVGVPGDGDRVGVVDLDDLRVALDGRHVRMRLDAAPPRGERDLVVGRGVGLPLEADHEVVHERGVHRRERRVVDVGDVDARDHCAQGAGLPCDLHR